MNYSSIEIILGSRRLAWFVALTCLFYATSATAVTPFCTATGGSSESFNWSIAPLADIDGQGHPGFVVGSPSFHNSGNFESGKLTIFSGNCSQVRVIEGASSSSGLGTGLGEMVVSIGDINGDHITDFAAYASGNAGVEFGGIGAPYVMVYSGATGLPIFTIPTFVKSSTSRGDSHTLSGAGDIDGDGYPDILIVGSIVSVYSGRTGLPIVQSYAGDNSLGSFAAATRDYDGDGLPDLIVSHNDFTRQIAQSHIQPRYPWDFLPPTYAKADFCPWGRYVSNPNNCNQSPTCDLGGCEYPAVIDDLNHDGYPDVAFGEWSDSQIRIVSGKTPDFPLLRVIQGAQPNDGLGYRVQSFPDIDGDSVGDILASSYGSSTISQYVGLFSGASGEMLYQIVSPSQTEGFGAISRINDVNGDGRADILIGVGVNKVELFTGPSDGDLLNTSDYFQIGSTTVCF